MAEDARRKLSDIMKELAGTLRHLCLTAGMSEEEARWEAGKLRDILRGPKR